MPTQRPEPSKERLIDVRQLPDQERERTVYETYIATVTGAAIVVLTDYDPQPLRSALERELAGAFSWEELSSEHAREHRIRITKLASTGLPRVVADTTTLVKPITAQTSGAIWKLEPGDRGLDSNIIALAPGDEIASHVGPDLDVLIFVLSGSGELYTELNSIPLQEGTLVWLPQKSHRHFSAGADGLQYLTVHQRKPTLNISPRPQQ